MTPISHLDVIPMKIIIVLISLFLSPVLWADDDCSFDQENQVAVLTAIAQSKPGATLDVEKRQVSWGASGTDMTFFSYGGCEDLGSMVTRSTPMKSPRTHEQVFSLARELARRFWNNQKVAADGATATLLAGLSAKRFEVEKLDDSTIYRVLDKAYVELYVEHAYTDGIDTVTIGWQGNF